MATRDIAGGAAYAPKVSVVVPVFNAAIFLDVAIGSVIGQTYGEWELILVDDGSTDTSRSVCDGYAQRDKRIRVVARPNRGPAAARNAGVREATGEFVCFLDADDYLFPDALAALVAAAENHNADMALGNFSKREDDHLPVPQPAVFRPDGEPFRGDYRVLAGGELLEYVRHFLRCPSNHLVSYCWARLYRLAAIRKCNLEADENMRLFEDFAFNLAYLGTARTVVFVNQPVYAYVLRGNHMSASMAVLDAPRLIADMRAFRLKVNAFLGAIGAEAALAESVIREAGHTLIHYSIIFLVRTCRQLTVKNSRSILRQVRQLISAPLLRECLACYAPRPGDSRILPVLMRFELTWLLILVAWVKGNRRYGRLRGRPS